VNRLFFLLILLPYVWSAFQSFLLPEATPVPMQLLTTAMLDAASSAVTLAFSLIGVMAFFLGIMKIAEEAGLLQILAKLLRPILIKLFPEIPSDHPAMGAMIMNLSANIIGIGNAATPFGLKAMEHLDSLNPHKGTATNAMVLFLAINTAGVTLIPTSVIALRQASGSVDPASIIASTLFATTVSLFAAIVGAKFFQRFWTLPDIGAAPCSTEPTTPLWKIIVGILCFLVFVLLIIRYGQAISPWFLPSLICALLSYGVWKHVKIYDCFIEGAKEGFGVTLRIMPYLIAILVAIKMLTASGILPAMVNLLSPITSLIGIPAEALPMALLRPLSGSGSYATLAAVFQDPNLGPDSLVGYLVSTIYGSSETTFYVLAVYFGSIHIQKIRHALLVGLFADVIALLSSAWIVNYMYA
jgi:spore maturation protein SpmA